MKSATLFILIIVLVLASFLTVSAQPPESDYRPGQANDTPTAEAWRDPVAGPFVQPATAPASAAVDLGQPGLSYRYVRTYGETRVPYLADNDHLFRPWGITVDSSGNVYITEQSGHRMMKFTSSGDFLLSIGQAGDWIAEGANRVSKWDATASTFTRRILPDVSGSPIAN